jgi:L-threonine kinase
MQPSQLLYQAFPVELRETYRDAVQAPDWSSRHSGLLDFGEATLRYLGSLCLSDYRTRSARPVQRVETLLERSRNRNLTLGAVLDLFKASVLAMPDALIPGPGAFDGDDLAAMRRFTGAVEAIKAATDGLSHDASPTAIDVSVHVQRNAELSDAMDWWRGWERLVMYRNKVSHAAQSRWPTRSRDYWEVMGPLLHEAIVELMTQAPVAGAILDHPVASVTLISATEDGRYSHSVCGERRGVWFEQDVVTDERVTEQWVDEHWKATTASSYILEPAADGWQFRSLFWDLRNGLPPAMNMRLGDEDGNDANPTVGEKRSAPRSTAKEGRGTAPGTCGEFIQGILPNGTPFHVTCPINKSATVVAQIRPADKLSVIGLHDHHRKLGLAIEYAVEHLDLGAVEVTIRHWSDLDIGKGMGSSTADVLAGIRAVADAAGESLDAAVEGRLAARVESSDGSMYEGIAAVNHKTCELVKSWDWYPEFVIVMLVPHDSVDTHSIPFSGQEELAEEYETLLEQMDRAVRERSIGAFAEQSTRSAAFNERFLLNPYARSLTDRLHEFDALGVSVGHTGTVCGLLFANTEAGRMLASDTCFAVRKQFPELKGVKVVTTPHCPGAPAAATAGEQPG